MPQLDCLQVVVAAFVSGVFYPIVGVALLLWLERRWDWFHRRLPNTWSGGLLAALLWPAVLAWIFAAEVLARSLPNGRKAKAA